MLAIFDKIKEKLNGKTAAILATSICLLAVPVLMAKENWNDHDRSGKYTALEIARNYLKSCDKNAVLFTNGDNDTFPLWYIQEVEGFRTDIKIVNLSLLGMDWYIDQMKRATYEAPPIPSALNHKDYRGSKNNQVLIDRNRKKYVLITKAIKDIQEGKPCPKNIKLLVDSSNLSHLNIPEGLKSNIVNEIKFTIKGQALTKSDLLLLDIIANFNWKQAIYFSSGQGLSKFKGLENFVHPFGAVYQLLPYSIETGIDTEKMHQLLIGENAYKYGGINDSNVYIDYTTKISLAAFRQSYWALAQLYLQQDKNEKAIEIADKYFEEFEWSTGLLDPVSINIAAVYAQTGEIEKGEIITEMLQENILQLNYLKTQQLSGDAQQLLQATGKNVKTLTNIKTQISNNKEKAQNEADGNGPFTIAQL